MRAAIVATLGCALTVAVGADPLPAGRVSLVVGIKSGTGSLSSSIGNGYGFGFEASYAPMSRNQRVGWGVSWATTWSRYGAGSARIADEMSILEMDAGVRLRVALGVKTRQVLFLGGGGALVRSNEPIFVGDDRSRIGPWGSAGIEGRAPIANDLLVGVAVRYGYIRDGDGVLSVMISAGVGK